jgi:hypothetical protein
MSKRVLAGTLGLLAMVAGCGAALYAIKGSQDFKNPGVDFWGAALGELAMCSMAFAALGIGLRLLDFASTGRENPIHGWMRPVPLGTGMFFPGFVFSLPLTLFCANRIWRNDRQSPDIALEVSLGIGFASAILCMSWMLKKHKVLGGGR